MQDNKELSGVLLIDKGEGVTSHDVVSRVRRLYHTRRVGHTGTLDPLATGVLVILIGRAAKAAEYLAVHDKTYVATLRLGITTDTEDVTGKVQTIAPVTATPDEVIAAANGFVGEYWQTPPMYSALKVNGQKLVDLARRGIEVEREARPVTIHEMDCTPCENGDYTLRVSCSSGTYIRTLCADIGEALGCGGCMSALRRTRAGDFNIADAHTLEEIRANPEGYILPVELITGKVITNG